MATCALALSGCGGNGSGSSSADLGIMLIQDGNKQGIFNVTRGAGIGGEVVADPVLHIVSYSLATDGRVAYKSEDDVAGTETVHILTRGGVVVDSATVSVPVETGGAVAWSPDGQKLAVVSMVGTNCDIFTMSPSGPMTRTALTTVHDVHNFSQIAWSSDGNIYFFRSGIGGSLLWKVPSQGGSPTQVSTTPGVHVTASPDGTKLAYLTNGYKSVTFMDLSDLTEHNVVTVSGTEFFFQTGWTTDGKVVFTHFGPDTGIHTIGIADPITKQVNEHTPNLTEYGQVCTPGSDGLNNIS